MLTHDLIDNRNEKLVNHNQSRFDKSAERFDKNAEKMARELMVSPNHCPSITHLIS
ncbi:MAG: hypothetical protein ONB44_10910 [candidate division KSB1 bacterium]|nr:hypothetical protein [candidate division KSB1 bacterium]MDZ7302634.1 hypothetical protein [candidate division KSB1 bacterium]MDZ7311527.1 hypothetical protein [candidate division KSB1 bacterium]